MSFIDQLKKKWARFRRKMQPTVDKIMDVALPIVDKVSYVWNYVKKFKKLFLAAPVATMALILAILNLFKLPALVGLDLQGNGDFRQRQQRNLPACGEPQQQFPHLAGRT